MFDISELKNRFNFGSGINRSGNDFRIISSSFKIKKKYNLLLFTDSKGSNFLSNTNNCWTDKLLNLIKKKSLSYLFISRPKEMTTFISLINFLNLNSISFNYLITNVGYADITPSKSFFINDIKSQLDNTIYDLKLKPHKLEKYKLSNGKYENLYSYNYGEIENLISSYLDKNFNYGILLGTMLFFKEN